MSRPSPTAPQEHKTFPGFTLAANQSQGVVEHIVAVLGNLDDGDDIIHPGAFKKTLQERASRVRVLDQHRSDSILRILGKPLEMREVGRADLPPQLLDAFPDATGGLYCKTQYLMNTPEGAGAFERAKEGLLEYSIGFDAVAGGVDYSKSGTKTVRNLRELRLWEYSPVLWGMNPATTTISAKGAGGFVPDHDGPDESKSEWSTAYKNSLPDSAFAWVESGGSKDDEGKTEPRSLRHYPHHDAEGAVDLPHLRNALARGEANDAPAAALAHLRAHAKAEGVGEAAEKASGADEAVRVLKHLKGCVPLVGTDNIEHTIDLLIERAEKKAEKAGRSISAATMTRIQAIHDHTTDLGATCSSPDEPEKHADPTSETKAAASASAEPGQPIPNGSLPATGLLGEIDRLLIDTHLLALEAV